MQKTQIKIYSSSVYVQPIFRCDLATPPLTFSLRKRQTIYKKNNKIIHITILLFTFLSPKDISNKKAQLL